VATGDLTTLANVKAWLGLSQAADDAGVLARLITAASTNIQSWLNRTIAIASFTEVRDGTGTPVLMLRHAPVTSITALVIGGVAVTAAAGTTDQGYRVAGRKLLLNTSVFAPGVGNVTVTYQAGYATTPPDLEQAVIELISLRYKERDRIGHTSKTLAGETVAFFIGDMPASVKTVLMQYREVVPI
jgi:uncharacterized phiE125 gp8 family phage protein